MKIYTLEKSKNILRQNYRLFKRRSSLLSKDLRDDLKNLLMNLQDAILNHNQELASSLAKEVEIFAKNHFKKSLWNHFTEGTFALAFALFFAIIIRQGWFELYEIPSGSMRPTLKEQDGLIVSKTQFGLNIPLSTSHLLFEPSEVKRMEIVVFTGKNMDIQGTKTRYFYIFPGHKQYVKRMIGLPGDTLYFYGGKIYGIDKYGNDISNELQSENVNYLEHIPFISLDGRVKSPGVLSNGIFSPVIIQQMNEPLAKLYVTHGNRVQSELLLPPNPQSDADLSTIDLYNYWGMENFATSRIVKRADLYQNQNFDENLYPGVNYFLELSHHASLKNASVNLDYTFKKRPRMKVHTSLIPLNKEKLEEIWSRLYTARFISEDGILRRYGSSKKAAKKNTSFQPKISYGVPNGMYEFQDGKVQKVGLMGILKDLPQDHPLNFFSEENCYLLYNLGIDFDTRFILQNGQGLRPSRYAYFRNGNLYLMGHPIFQKKDPLLQKFVSLEQERTVIFTNYAPFIDQGPPLTKEGELDIKFIQTFGITVPDRHYLVLGDNHAVSGDSREFGFVPEDNIRGVPSLVFWGPNNRFGMSASSAYPIFTSARIVVWSSAGLFFLVWRIIRYRRNKLPLKF